MAFLKGFGACLPPRVVGNLEMSALSGSAPEWILNVSGIEERRFAAPGSKRGGSGHRRRPGLP